MFVQVCSLIPRLHPPPPIFKSEKSVCVGGGGGAWERGYSILRARFSVMLSELAVYMYMHVVMWYVRIMQYFFPQHIHVHTQTPLLDKEYSSGAEFLFAI